MSETGTTAFQKSLSLKNALSKIRSYAGKPLKAASQYKSEYEYINKLIEDQTEISSVLSKEFDKIKFEVDKTDKEANDSRVKSKKL